MCTETQATASAQRVLAGNIAIRRWARVAYGLLWAGVVCAYITLVAGYAEPWAFDRTSTAYLWAAWVGFMGRTWFFHFGLLSAVLAIPVALKRRVWLAAALASLALVGLGAVSQDYVERRAGPVGETLRVLTLNLSRRNGEIAAVLREVQRVHPDVICVQEYNERWAAALAPEWRTEFPYVCGASTNQARGAAIFSRLPLEDQDGAELPLGPKCGPQMRAVVRVHGRAVAIYCIHMLPPSSGWRFGSQNAQFARLLDVLGREAVPTVLCGDFNFTNRSAYADALMDRNFLDANRCVGVGLASTWPADGPLGWLPLLRIDHIYLGRSLSCRSAQVGEYVGSDHRPVIADVGFAEP